MQAERSRLFGRDLILGLEILMNWNYDLDLISSQDLDPETPAAHLNPYAKPN